MSDWKIQQKMSYGHLAVDYHESIISEALKSLIKDFLKNNIGVFPNQRDVVRRRISSQNHDPHEKHFLDLTQKQFLQNLFVCIIKF